MQNSVLYLACSSLVPILCADVTAGSSCDVHLGLICVAALGALPDELSVFVAFNDDLTVNPHS